MLYEVIDLGGNLFYQLCRIAVALGYSLVFGGISALLGLALMEVEEIVRDKATKYRSRR